MDNSPDQICPQPDKLPEMPTAPLATPIFLSSVYQCADPDQADAILGGRMAGYVYSRDGHPNADLLAEKCRQLHAAERAAIAPSGMGALALALLSQCRAGDHVLLSNRLYGRTMGLFANEAMRLGITCTVVDTSDPAATAAAVQSTTRMVVVETITNPTLRVNDIGALAEVCDKRNALLLVDNTFASPFLCRPLELGASLVHESLTKIMNGHSDVMLGLLCGRASQWDRIVTVLSTWGLCASPFDCWLAERGLATLHLRAERASENALQIARFLASHQAVEAVHYPGLEQHPDHELARRQFGERFGTMVTFVVRGGIEGARKFIIAASNIPFCPSLGEVSTTLSHPESTSHRGVSPQEREALGIGGGMIRLSVGTEDVEFLKLAIENGLREVA